MSHWDFPGSEPIDVLIDLASGSVALTAKETDATTVSLAPSRFGRNADKLLSEVRVGFDNGRLEVVGTKRAGLFRGSASFDVTITLPEGSRGMLRTASADIICTGDLADLEVHTASGDITAAVSEIQEAGIIVVCTNMAGSVVKAADLVVSDPLEAGVMAVMLVADTAQFSIEMVRGRRF